MVALALCAIMVVSAFVSFGPLVAEKDVGLEEKMNAAETSATTAVSPREVSLTMSNMFEIYVKDQNGSSMGRWSDTMGLNGWWPLRQSNYGEWMARGTYPFVLCYDPYSTQTSPDLDMGNSITSWYRLYVDAKNITEIGTDIGKDPLFVPVMGNPSQAGGWVNLSWYSTYLETWELTSIRAGTHYANSYYGVPTAGTTPRASADDGYWHELQGKMSFTRAAAKKFLGLPGTGNLKTEYNASKATIESNWLDNWLDEGGGIYDIYTAYDYSDDIRVLVTKLDPDWYGRDPETLHLRIYSISWGNEVLLMRYMEAANVLKNWQGWPDDWYLNVTVGPSMGKVVSRAVIGYHMYAVKDSLNTIGAWALEASHIDWAGNTQIHQGYQSPYNAYDPDQTATTHVSWAPLTVKYGLPVSYIVPPLQWNLTAGEKIVIKLPSESKSIIGYKPVRSTSDTLGAAKMAELATNSYWGELVMGNGYPSSGPTNLKNYYNAVTKTITLAGPVSFPLNRNPAFPTILDTGAPMFVLDVAKVSSYQLAIVGESAPYDLNAGQEYTLRVTAKNATGATVTDWNGTSSLSSTDSSAVFGQVTHNWVVGDAGDYETTVAFNAEGSWSVSATDASFSMDVGGSIDVTVSGGPQPTYGLLRVTTNPAVPTMISIDGVWASPWGLNWVKLDPGTYTLSFSDVPGFVTPADVEVTIVAGETTNYMATFVPCGSLRVITSPAVPSTIYVNGIPRNDWGFWVDVPAGTYTVSFGAVANYNTPAPQTVTVTSGGYAEVTGVFTSNPGAPGPDPATYGLLRVTTNPAVPSMIYINGVWASPWGLNWVKLAPGTYTLTFSDVPGFVTPADVEVTIVAGETTNYMATFVPCGSLRVITSPAVPSTIYVNGIPRNDWGFWVDVPAGTYTVSFGAVANYNTPAPQTVTVTSGGYAEVTGVFTSNPGAPGPDPATYGLLRVTTNPAVPSMIYINGVWASPWGLNWVKLAPGTYTLTFSDVPGFITPAPMSVTIGGGGAVTERVVNFGSTGSLRVITSPAVPSTIYVDGIARNDWGMWADVPPATYVVSFGDVPGYVTPSPQTVTVTPGGYTEVTGVFVPG
ncbi:MAG: hypothetical protein A3K67_05355 [Euryarchaeota archaeon RBG_16_62_10]|nr:MAG: hypothetical protein A3K67_05355 [Euryarchaeota archaeon RBG_16_62_10]